MLCRCLRDREWGRDGDLAWRRATLPPKRSPLDLQKDHAKADSYTTPLDVTGRGGEARARVEAEAKDRARGEARATAKGGAGRAGQGVVEWVSIRPARATKTAPDRAVTAL